MPFIDPAAQPYALQGRIVTMNDAFDMLDDGALYIAEGRVAAVQSSTAPVPPGFEHAPVIRMGGSIYPGLIELHNHLSYNILPLWDVPQRFTNRDQWSRGTTYRKLISGPMNVLGQTTGFVEAIVRYVECKCLLGGVTTSQGIALFSNQGIVRHYRGVVRNVEQPDDPQLPGAATSIADIEATEADAFLARLRRASCLLLHLSEGIDDAAHRHFEALHLRNNTWALTDALTGIHCVALDAADFQTMHEHGASMVWSPFSNLLLYGKTVDIKAAKAAGLQIALGSDWSPSGSKNLLGELKVARLVSDAAGGIFSDRELVAMATRNPAHMLKWDAALGTLEAGKRADLLVTDGQAGDPYSNLIEARETAIKLVVIDGVPRYGQPRVMQRFAGKQESWQVGRTQRMLNLQEADSDPVVGSLSLREAQTRLQDGLQQLAQLARDLEQTPRGLERVQPEWTLVLDHDEPEDMVTRPYLDMGAHELAADRGLTERAAVPLSQLLEPLALDPLTVADDRTFLHHLAHQPNLPTFLKEELPKLYT
jgi:cytosine/adenosine deaminase-related metal-dependent hydrolase